MPRLYSTGWRSPICLCWVNHASWQGVSSNWGRWWSSMFLSLMIPSWMVWPYWRVPQRSDWVNHSWGCPTHLHWCSNWRGHGGGSSPCGGLLEEPTTPQVPHEKQMKVGASPNQFPGWKKVLHPSQLVTTAGQASVALSKLRQRHCNLSSGERRAQCQRAEECLQVKQAEWDSTSLPRSPEPMQGVALPLGFKEVMACLQRDPLPVTAFKVPLEPTQPEAMVKPMVATVCASHIVQDEAMGITYMDTVNTSVGQVALGCSYLTAPIPRLTIEDVTNLP